jgi:hypothetical protein
MMATTGQLLATDDVASAYLMKTLPVSRAVGVGFAFYVATEQFSGDGSSFLASIVFDDGAVVLLHDELGRRHHNGHDRKQRQDC